jgi:hypothetical protein
MKADTIHYVSEEFVDRFVWGVGTTVCGKDYDHIVEHTSNIEYVTCKKCLKSIEKNNQ